MKKSPPHSTHVGRIHTIPVGRPWEMIGVDTVGPLPITDRKNQYITVFTDHFTKWVEVFATPRSDSLSMAKLFVEEVICRHGAPQKLLSDRGAAFLSRMSRHLYRLLNVKKVNTSAYHPQTDGLNERYNKTVIIMLSMYVGEHQKDWDVYLPYVRFAYNTSIQSSTGETPFFLMHGRDAVIPLQVRYAHMDIQAWQPKDYRRQVLEGLQQVFQKVRYTNDRKRQAQESYLDECRIDSPYQVGDLVWIFTPAVRSGNVLKLSHPWRGPFRITECPSPVTVRVHNLAGKPLHQQVHVMRLKPYNSPDEPTSEPISNELNDDFDPGNEEALFLPPEEPESTFDEEVEPSHSAPSRTHHISEMDEDSPPSEIINDALSSVPSSTSTSVTQHTRAISKKASISDAMITSSDNHPSVTDSDVPAWPEELPSDFNLPKGWRIEKRTCKSGKTAGTVGFCYFNPMGRNTAPK